MKSSSFIAIAAIFMLNACTYHHIAQTYDMRAAQIIKESARTYRVAFDLSHARAFVTRTAPDSAVSAAVRSAARYANLTDLTYIAKPYEKALAVEAVNKALRDNKLGCTVWFTPSGVPRIYILNASATQFEVWLKCAGEQ